MGAGGEGGLQDAVTVPRVGTNIRLQAVAAAPAASSHCHLNGNANSRRSECCRYRGNAEPLIILSSARSSVLAKSVPRVIRRRSNLGLGPRERPLFINY